jgi:hypothetical protein
LYVPEETLRSGAITLSATVDGQPLLPAVYDSAGLFHYVREIVATGDVEVRFTLDRALPPDENDSRERGIIVAAIAIT